MFRSQFLWIMWICVSVQSYLIRSACLDLSQRTYLFCRFVNNVKRALYALFSVGYQRDRLCICYLIRSAVYSPVFAFVYIYFVQIFFRRSCCYRFSFCFLFLPTHTTYNFCYFHILNPHIFIKRSHIQTAIHKMKQTATPTKNKVIFLLLFFCVFFFLFLAFRSVVRCESFVCLFMRLMTIVWIFSTSTQPTFATITITTTAHHRIVAVVVSIVRHPSSLKNLIYISLVCYIKIVYVFLSYVCTVIWCLLRAMILCAHCRAPIFRAKNKFPIYMYLYIIRSKS